MVLATGKLRSPLLFKCKVCGDPLFNSHVYVQLACFQMLLTSCKALQQRKSQVNLQIDDEMNIHAIASTFQKSTRVRLEGEAKACKLLPVLMSCLLVPAAGKGRGRRRGSLHRLAHNPTPGVACKPAGRIEGQGEESRHCSTQQCHAAEHGQGNSRGQGSEQSVKKVMMPIGTCYQQAI